MFVPVQFGAVEPLKRPQSSILRSSWPSSAPVSTGFEVESVNVPGTLPVFAMSTVPGTLSPGFKLGALNSALDALEPMVSVPAVKVLDGLAACAVKFAPEPTVMPTAARTTASAPMVRRGCAARADRRDTGTASVEGIWGHGPASPRWLGPLRPYSRGVPGHTVHVGMPGADLEARSDLLRFSCRPVEEARLRQEAGAVRSDDQRVSASDAGVSGSQSTAPPRPADFRTFSDSSAHFMRVAEMSIPRKSSMNERSSFSRSATGMPLTSSEAIDAAAWLIAQPWPSNRMSSIVPPSSTRSITRSSSPHSGFVSSNSRSGESIGPQLWGRL